MNPQLIQIMRAALEEVMAKIPADDSIFGIKAAMAEVILKAAGREPCRQSAPRRRTSL